MKVNQFLNSNAGQVVIISAVAAVVVYYAGKKAKQVAQAINPVSTDNIAYTGVNSVGAVLTDNKRFDLGVWIYDKIHGTG